MRVTAYFFDEDDARRGADRLRAGGFDAEVSRGRFAGEDDDEDQPWVLETDAPDLVVEVACDEEGGWVEYEDGPTPSPAHPPLPLPDDPIRSREGRGCGT